ncbi:MAG: vWA domain-containing protein, partial [Myxococcota bacterium]
MNRILLVVLTALALSACGASRKASPSYSHGADPTDHSAGHADAPADYAAEAAVADRAESDVADVAALEASVAVDGAAAPSSGTPRVHSRARRAAPRPTVARAAVRAGEWDDNANYREFQRFLDSHRGHGQHVLDIRDRRFLVVRDSAGKAVPGCRITVSDRAQNRVSLTTMSSGRAILFPRAEGLRGSDLQADLHCLGARSTRRLSLQQSDGAVVFQLPAARPNAQRVVDIAFVLDTTGSMSEEIAAVKATIHSVASMLREQGVSARIGLVEYKDRGDAFVTRVFPLSSDIQAFAAKVSSIAASGGGDTPEAVNDGLRVALAELDWNAQATARLAFLIGDAAPQLRYAQDVSYAQSARNAAHRG